MHYVIEMRDTSMRAIGPFASNKAAAEWGSNHNPDDDPRWQTIELDVEDGDDLIVMPIVAPARHMHAENDPSDCESCDGYGRVWKHADPTTGQSVECEVCQPVSKGAGSATGQSVECEVCQPVSKGAGSAEQASPSNQ